MRKILGACHCGNLSYTLEWPDEGQMRFVRCGCSFCAKHGGVYTSHPRAALTGQVRESTALSRYTFATRTADVFICARCGVAPWMVSVIDGQTFAVVNANTFEVPPPLERIPLRAHDSDRLEDRIARRKRWWIPVVEIAFPA